MGVHWNPGGVLSDGRERPETADVLASPAWPQAKHRPSLSASRNLLLPQTPGSAAGDLIPGSRGTRSALLDAGVRL